MNGLLLVGVGGAIGAIARYKLGGLVLHHTEGWRFPVSTFVVNVLGCLVAGLLAGLAEKHDAFSPDLRLLLFTGLLGGFTTFSAFGLETVTLFQKNMPFIALLNIAASVLCGVSALWLGVKFIG
jgi:CrcB protein